MVLADYTPALPIFPDNRSPERDNYGLRLPTGLEPIATFNKRFPIWEPPLSVGRWSPRLAAATNAAIEVRRAAHR